MNTATALDFKDRSTGFNTLEDGIYDVLVIGAGITGCGIARDAAMRGLRTALVDAGDIGSGTSSRSSKLVHGGLRYLAMGQLGVVREAANERRILRQLAPHLSQTNPMVVLATSRKALAMLKTALWTYEKMGHVDKQERHHVWSRRELHEAEPFVAPSTVAGAVVYPEYLTDDGRLTLANARSAAAHGAQVLTYARVDRLLAENQRITGAQVRSALPHESHEADIRARIIVNAAGPWVDALRRLEDESADAKLQLTKGIHLVFYRDRLPIQRTVVWNAADGRSLFAVPRGRFVYLGTTDTFFEDPEYWPGITTTDVHYLLDSASSVFSGDSLKPDDILSIWSGLRPLLGSSGKKPSEISRKDEVMAGPGGVLSIAGGKLTSYRSMAERMVDRCEEKLHRKPRQSRTAEEPLPGGDFTESLTTLQNKVQQLGLDKVEAERGVRLYGSEALEIFRDGQGPAVEAAYAVRQEGALTLEDYWVRRSARAWFDDNGGLDALESAADGMAAHLGWSAEERQRQIQTCRQRRQMDMAVLESN